MRANVNEVRGALISGIDEVTIVAGHGPGEEAEVDFGTATVTLASVPVPSPSLRLGWVGNSLAYPS